MKKYYYQPVLLLIIMCAVFFCASAEETQEALSDKLIRLHVVAASDSESDQSLKLEIRDEVLAYIAPLLEGCESREDAERLLIPNLAEIERAASDRAFKSGVSVNITASIEREYFPERQYDGFSLPAGEYSAVRIVINEGGGKNWWCVVFPPLCSEAAISKESGSRGAFAGLTGEEARLITGEDEAYIIKFKLLDVISWFKQLIK